MERSNNFTSRRVPYGSSSKAEEAIRYYKAVLARAFSNLKNAEDRGDVRAVANIERKIEIYEYTIKLIQETELMFN